MESLPPNIIQMVAQQLPSAVDATSLASVSRALRQSIPIQERERRRTHGRWQLASALASVKPRLDVVWYLSPARDPREMEALIEYANGSFFHLYSRYLRLISDTSANFMCFVIRVILFNWFETKIISTFHSRRHSGRHRHPTHYSLDDISRLARAFTVHPMQRNPVFMRAVSKVAYPFLFQIVRRLRQVTGQNIHMPRNDSDMFNLAEIWKITAQTVNPDLLVQNLSFSNYMVVIIAQTISTL